MKGVYPFLDLVTFKQNLYFRSGSLWLTIISYCHFSYLCTMRTQALAFPNFKCCIQPCDIADISLILLYLILTRGVEVSRVLLLRQLVSHCREQDRSQPVSKTQGPPLEHHQRRSPA